MPEGPGAPAPASPPGQGGTPLHRAIARMEAVAPLRRWAIGAGAVLLAFAVAVKLLIFPWAHGDPIDVTVEEGSSVADVARDLDEKGVVPSALVLELWIAASGSTREVMPGEYRFKRGIPYGRVIADLKEGTNIPTVDVVIPEGFNVRQIAARLDAKTHLDGDKFEQLAFSGAKRYDLTFLKSVTGTSLEGYLFPKTYPVREDTTEEQVLQRMVEQFGKDTAGLPWARATRLGLTAHQVLTVASMIEKESSRAQERRRIAGVIYNRLNQGLPPGDVYGPRQYRLQIDATVLYALGRDSGGLKSDEYQYLDASGRIQRDKYTDWRYNTYIIGPTLPPGAQPSSWVPTEKQRLQALPPGPICSPSAASVYAALVPEEHDLFFYVAKGDGSHEFAATWDEFKAVKRELGYGD